MGTDFRVIEKHPLILRILHWINVLLLPLMIWSGLLIYWADPFLVPILDEYGPIVIHHRLAEGMGWHFFIMWPFVINGLSYVLFLFLKGEWRRIFPNRSDLKNFVPFILYDLKLRKSPVVFEGKFNPAQKVAYTCVLFFAFGSLITGLAIYKPVQLSALIRILGGYRAARAEHFIFMLSLVFFIFVHVIQVIRAGWNNFRAMVTGYEIQKK